MRVEVADQKEEDDMKKAFSMFDKSVQIVLSTIKCQLRFLGLFLLADDILLSWQFCSSDFQKSI